MRVAAGACARAGGSAHHRADSSARTAIDAIVALTRPIIPLSFWLERCAHRELDITDFYLARGGRVETVVDPDGTEGRVPAETGSHRVLELREVDGRAEALVRSVNVAHVEEEGGANAERQRHGVFEVAEDLEGPPDLGARGVFRRDLAGLEAADGIRPAEEVALEERHGILRPSEHVPRQETPAQSAPKRAKVPRVACCGLSRVSRASEPPSIDIMVFPSAARSSELAFGSTPVMFSWLSRYTAFHRA